MLSSKRLITLLSLRNLTAEDLERLEECKNRAVDYIERLLDRPLSVTNFSDIIDYQGEEYIILPLRGVITSSVALYTRPDPSQSFTEVTEGFTLLEEDEVYIYEPQRFYLGRKTLKVSYQAGWNEDSLPTDLEAAVVQAVRTLYKARDLALEHETVNETSLSYRSGDFLPRELKKAILLRYARRRRTAWTAERV